MLISHAEALNVFLALIAIFMLKPLLDARDGEKRNRLHCLLPLPARALAVARVMQIMLPLAAFYLVFFPLHALIFANAAGWRESELELLMLLGLSLIAYAFFFVLRDTIQEFRQKKMNAVKIFVSVLLCIFCILLAGAVSTMYNSNQYIGETFAILLIPFSFSLFYLSIVTFKKRASYLD
ncbi:hypothetical protein KC734_08930 [candidate division KSB1 bacterium]|nr:hypothetical protein [candidate division KSB1 bacterium]